MSGGAPGMNQPILIPFNAGGHLGGQQGLVLSLPTANIQSLVAAAAAGGIMTLPLQNLQGEGRGQPQVHRDATYTRVVEFRSTKMNVSEINFIHFMGGGEFEVNQYQTVSGQSFEFSYRLHGDSRSLVQ